jgi:hypothetical protein
VFGTKAIESAAMILTIRAIGAHPVLDPEAVGLVRSGDYPKFHKYQLV